MEREIEIIPKEDDSYKLVIKVELNDDDEELLKKRLNLLALSPNLSEDQVMIIETFFGYYWYKNCEMWLHFALKAPVCFPAIVLNHLS